MNAVATKLYVDVRTPGEFSEAHIDGAVNVPLMDINSRADEIKKLQHDYEVVLVCRTDRRAGLARKTLAAAGVDNMDVLRGGMEQWMGEGRDVIRGRKGMSLERQVRIAAGTLVLIGVVLAWLIHPGFIGISAFVGCGLIFAGLTDTCGMAMMLAALPFNRSKNAQCALPKA